MASKIFLDGGDPKETEDILSSLGFLDGQTTNPTLIAKNPAAANRLAKGEKFDPQEIIDFYKNIVSQISQLIPQGSVSIEVYSDQNTTVEQMVKEGREMGLWIPNAHIKLPITKAGLEAASILVGEGKRVNMTLCFSQSQAAAVYSATKPASRGQVFVSPFVGRLDDCGENGMDLIKNILEMYKSGDGHVEVLTASVRSMDHFLESLKIGSDIITSPFKILKEWVANNKSLPGSDFVYNPAGLKSIPYENLNLEKDWQEFDILHTLTDKGIDRFATDWNSLIK